MRKLILMKLCLVQGHIAREAQRLNFKPVMLVSQFSSISLIACCICFLFLLKYIK